MSGLSLSEGLRHIAGLSIDELRRRLEDEQERMEIPAATLARIVTDVGKLELAAHDRSGGRTKLGALEMVMRTELPRERKIALVAATAGVSAEKAERMLEERTQSKGELNGA